MLMHPDPRVCRSMGLPWGCVDAKCLSVRRVIASIHRAMMREIVAIPRVRQSLRVFGIFVSICVPFLNGLRPFQKIILFDLTSPLNASHHGGKNRDIVTLNSRSFTSLIPRDAFSHHRLSHACSDCYEGFSNFCNSA